MYEFQYLNDTIANASYYLDIMHRFTQVSINTLFKDVIHGTYNKPTKYKIIWSNALCHYRDLVFTMWLKITNRNTMIDAKIMDELKLPSNKCSIIIRFEITGFVVINSNSPDGVIKINKIKSYPFSVKFTFEIPNSYIIKQRLNNQIFKRFMIHAEKKFTQQHPHIDLDKTTLMNFQTVFTDISVKEGKK